MVHSPFRAACWADGEQCDAMIPPPSRGHGHSPIITNMHTYVSTWSHHTLHPLSIVEVNLG